VPHRLDIGAYRRLSRVCALSLLAPLGSLRRFTPRLIELYDPFVGTVQVVKENQHASIKRLEDCKSVVDK